MKTFPDNVCSTGNRGSIAYMLAIELRLLAEKNFSNGILI